MDPKLSAKGCHQIKGQEIYTKTAYDPTVTYMYKLILIKLSPEMKRTTLRPLKKKSDKILLNDFIQLQCPKH